MVIRSYDSNDRQEVIALLRSNTPNFFAPSEEDDLKEYLDTEIEDYFVVEENREIIGSGGINYLPEQKMARISWDIIRSDSQGKGIGRKLLEHRIHYLNKNEWIDLITVRTSQLTHQFYEKIGFRLIEVKKDFWAIGFDLYYMELKNTR